MEDHRANPPTLARRSGPARPGAGPEAVTLRWGFGQRALLTALAGAALIAGCDCDDDPTVPVSVVALDFVAPTDGATLTALDDANPALDGVQPRIVLEVDGLDEGELRISTFSDPANANPDDSVTLEVSSTGQYETSDLTLAEGSNLITGELFNASGAVQAQPSITVTLELPTAQPTLTITAPADGSTLQDADAGVAGVQGDVVLALTDVPAGAPVTVSLNGTPAANDTASGGALTFAGLTFPPGTVTVEASAVVEGQTLTDQVSVTVPEDPDGCVVAILPEAIDFPCAFTANSQDADPDAPGFQTELTAEVSDCANAEVVFEVNGDASDPIAVSDGEARLVVTLDEGDNQVRAVATEGERSGASQDRVFTVDTVAPEVAFVSPLDGQTLTGADDRDGDISNGLDVVVEVEVTGDDVEEAQLDVDGTILTSPVDADGIARFDVTLADAGDVTLAATATDVCNDASASVDVTVSLTDATLQIDAPLDGAVLTIADDLDLDAPGFQSAFTVTASDVEEGAPVIIQCRRIDTAAEFTRGSIDKPAEDTFEIPVELPEGTSLCRARIEGDPTVSSDVVEVSVVLTDVSIAFVEPEDGALVNAPTLDVTAFVVDAPTAAATLEVTPPEGDPATYGAQAVAGNLRFEEVALGEGANTLTVSLDDDGTVRDTIEVTLDSIAPVLTLTNPAGDNPIVTEADDATGTLDDGFEINVVAQIEDASAVELVCLTAGAIENLCAVPSDDGTVTFTNVALVPGVVELRLTAEDAAGNIGETVQTLTVAIDRARVSITAPADNAAVAEPQVDVTVDVADLDSDAELRLLLNGAPAPTASANVTAPGQTVLFEAVALEDGVENVLVAEISDSRGTARSAPIRVRVLDDPPIVSILEPADGALINLDTPDTSPEPGFQTDVVVEVGVGGGLGFDPEPVLVVACEGAPPLTYDAFVERDSLDTFVAAFEDVTLEDQATCALTVTVVDPANQEGSDEVTVQLDRQAPELTFTRLTDGSTITVLSDEDPDTAGIQRSVLMTLSGFESGRQICLRDAADTFNTCYEAIGFENSFSFDAVTLPSGPTRLIASGSDAAGNTVEVSVEVLVNDNALTLSITTPTNNTRLNATADTAPNTDGFQTNVRVTGSQALAGRTIMLCSTGAPVDAPACQSAGFGVVGEATLDSALVLARFNNATLAEGTNRLQAETFIEDEDRWVLSGEISVVVDTTPPTVASLELTSDADANQRLGASEDERPQFAPFYGRFLVDIDGVVEGTFVSLLTTNTTRPNNRLARVAVDAEGRAAFVVALDEGPHTVTVAVTDRAGNALESSPALDFTIDMTPPTLSFLNLTANQTLNASNDADPATTGLQFGVRAGSNEPGVEIALVRVVGNLDAPNNPNGNDVVLGRAMVNADREALFDPFTLPQGNVRLALIASDDLGNRAVVTRDIRVDSIAPVVTLVAPQDGASFDDEDPAYADRPGFQIAARVTSDAIGEAVVIRDVDTDTVISDPAVIGAGGEATVVITVANGPTSIQAEVEDSAQNLGRSGVANIDVALQGCGLRLTAPDTNPIYVAQDNDGNPDNGAAVTFEAIVDSLLCVGQSVDLIVGGETVASEPVGLNGRVTFADVPFADPSTTQVFATVDDSFGESSTTRIVTVYVDLSPPTVELVAPADNPAFLSADDDLSGAAGLQLNLEVRVLDAVGGRLSVSTSALGEPLIEDMPVTGETMTLAGLTFPEGDQTVTVTVTDRVLSQATAEAQFVVDLDAPAAVTVASEVLNPRRGATRLTWSAPADSDAVSYRILRADSPISDATLDDAEVLEEVDATVPAGQDETFTVERLSWAPDLNSGIQTHFLTVVGVDAVGNVSAAGDVVVVDVGMREVRLSLQGEDGFGFAVSGIGDVNNDTFDDALITDPFTGAAWLLYGSDGALPNGVLSDTDVQRFEVDGLGFAFFGVLASPLGDINGDGIDDFAITAPFTGGILGSVFIYFGTDGGTLSGDPDVRINNATGNAYLGLSGIAGVGNFSDIGGEQLSDIVIGSTNEGAPGTTFAVLGRTDWPEVLDLSNDDATNAAQGVVRLVGIENGDEFGYRIAGLSDLDNDGFVEIAVTAPSANGDDGGVFVFFGGALADLGTLSALEDSITLLPAARNAQFGKEVISGDLDGDGVLDIVSSATITDTIGTYLFDQDVPAVITESWSVPGPRLYGEKMGLADLNDDGALDLFVGGFSEPSDGLLDFYFGDGNGSFGVNPDAALPNVRYDEDNSWAEVVSPLGDFNGDGLEDIIINKPDLGRVVIFY